MYKPALRRHQRDAVQPQLAIDAEFEAARRVARELVARRWPGLAQVQPTVGSRHRQVPDTALLQQLNIERHAPAITGADREFTFTFRRPPDVAADYQAPDVARVTVDSRQQVLKALVSK
jgi:hypothetical protein